MRKFLIGLLLIITSLCDAQTFLYKSYATSRGKKDLTYCIYGYGPVKTDSTYISLDLTNNKMLFGDYQYDIIEMPNKWTVKRFYRYCDFQCTNERIEKVIIRLFEYDSGKKRIVVFGEEYATKMYIQRIK